MTILLNDLNGLFSKGLVVFIRHKIQDVMEKRENIFVKKDRITARFYFIKKVEE